MGFSENSVRSTLLKKLSPNQHILAVSKLQPASKIKILYNQGQRDFGENYVQEALKKIEELSNLDISWHLIGPLQKNKVKYLKSHFAYIHSIDSFEIAEKVSEASIKNNYVQKVFLQLNLSEEKSKAGFTRDSLFKDWPKLSQLKGLNIVGLMTMPPLENNPEKNRAFFKDLKYIGNTLALKEFSMGTSHDFQIALEEGATWIRLGTMIFGERTMRDTEIK